MGYSPNNPPRLMLQRDIHYGPALWVYEATGAANDPGNDPEAPGFIRNAGALGMRSGDIVFVRRGCNVSLYTALVQPHNHVSAGPATLSNKHTDTFQP